MLYDQMVHMLISFTNINVNSVPIAHTANLGIDSIAQKVALHPLVMADIETPVFDLLDDDIFNLVVVSGSGFWGIIVTASILLVYWGVVEFCKALLN